MMLTKDDATQFLREIQPICNLRGVKILSIELAPATHASHVADAMKALIEGLKLPDQKAVNEEAARNAQPTRKGGSH